MATMSKAILSGSTHGAGIKVTTVAPIDGTDTAIHTAVNSVSEIDLVTLYAYNDDTATKKLHIGFGGTTDPDNLILVDIPPQAGLILVVADLPLRNNLAIVASGESANVLTVYGYVNQIRA